MRPRSASRWRPGRSPLSAPSPNRPPKAGLCRSRRRALRRIPSHDKTRIPLAPSISASPSVREAWWSARTPQKARRPTTSPWRARPPPRRRNLRAPSSRARLATRPGGAGTCSRRASLPSPGRNISLTARCSLTLSQPRPTRRSRPSRATSWASSRSATATWSEALFWALSRRPLPTLPSLARASPRTDRTPRPAHPRQCRQRPGVSCSGVPRGPPRPSPWAPPGGQAVPGGS